MNIYNKPKFENGKWNILVVNEHSLEPIRNLEFDTENDALIAYNKQIDKNNKEQHKMKLDKERKEANSLSDLGLGNLFGGNINGSVMTKEEEEEAKRILEEQREEDIEAHKEEFIRNEEECGIKAKNLLINVANLYLKNKLITENEYLKTKIDIEASSLASLIFQLHTTRKAIYKLSEKIHLGEATPRHFEVLTGLNRIVLDITKYQREYIKEIEDSMKQMFLDFADMPNKEEYTLEESKNSGLRLNDKKKLIEEIRSYILETKSERTIPRSRNTRLDSNDPNIVDVDYIEETNDEKEDDFTIKNGGLDTF